MIDLAHYKRCDFFSAEDQFRKYKDVSSTLLYGHRMENPVISIMIPCYRRTTFLRAAIRSAIRHKTNIPFEIVVVDNTVNQDDVLFVVNEFDDARLSYYRNEKNLGMEGNWNRCIELARAKYLCLLHDDDMLLEEWAERLWQIVDQYKTFACACNHEIIDENGNVTSASDEAEDIAMIYPHAYYFRQAFQFFGLLFSKEAAKKIGGFKEAAHPFSDSIFCAQLLDTFGPLPFWQQNLAKYRVAENESLNSDSMMGQIAYWAVFLDYYHQSKIDGIPDWFHKLHRDLNVISAEKGMELFGHLDYTELNKELEVQPHGMVARFLYKKYRSYLKRRFLHDVF